MNEWSRPGRKNLIRELSFQFSLDLIEYCTELEVQRQYVISRQLLKAGTSIGANVREAQSPESRQDFIHKMKIADKEAHETEYWLQLCKLSNNFPDASLRISQCASIRKVLNKILRKAKVNQEQQPH